MTRAPFIGWPDSTAALLREGYRFMDRRRRRAGADSFRCRLMLREALCISGPDAAARFYDGETFTRKGAMPPTTLRLLQDKKSVQLLDGAAHARRKKLFLSLLTDDAATALGEAFADAWRRELPAWRAEGPAPLHRKAQRMLCRAACAWAGAPVDGDVLDARTKEFAAMIDGAGSAGPKAIGALRLRARTERWARAQIAAAREMRATRTPIAAIAQHLDAEGGRLSLEAAGVELLNLLRPTVAIANYIVFVAVALHAHPAWRDRLRREPGAATRFVEEVRRFYPFFPFVGGRARKEFEWRGQSYPEGAWVLLDLYGVNRDDRIFAEPDRFDPDRFAAGADGHVPQGGGDPRTDHRCPGEGVTVEAMRLAALLLASTDYDAPAQDLSIDLGRMPALPKSRFVMAPT